MTFQACKMKFLNFMIIPVFHNLYQPCTKTFWILHEFGKYKRIRLLSFPPTQPAKVFLISSDSTVEQLEKFFCIPNVRLCLFSYHVLCKEQRKQ